jgi:hypothetical protein
MTDASDTPVATGLRLPAWLDERATLVARRTGVPRNTLIKIVLASALAKAIGPIDPEKLAAARRLLEDHRDRADPSPEEPT